MPKFANPHSLSQDVESTTRSEIAERTGSIFVHDESSHALKRDLDELLREAWADALAETVRAKKPKTSAEVCKNEDDELVFRLVSSMKHPQHISLGPKPQSIVISRGPECEDNEMQAEARRAQALSAAVDPEKLRETADILTRQVVSKHVIVKAGALPTSTPLARPLPTFLVTEEARAKTLQRVKTGNPQTNESPAVSPHEPRPSCVVLPVISVPSHKSTPGKKRRRPTKERPPPAYWRPSPAEVRGSKRCMGYALGYPSNWAPDSLYVRDTMKGG